MTGSKAHDGRGPFALSENGTQFRYVSDAGMMEPVWIHQELSEKSCWAQFSALDRIRRVLVNSILFGVFRDLHQMASLIGCCSRSFSIRPFQRCGGGYS